MYARRIRAWFRETPFRWSILTFFVPWFLRIPFAKLAKWRRGDLRYYYADGQNITGPLILKTSNHMCWQARLAFAHSSFGKIHINGYRSS